MGYDPQKHHRRSIRLKNYDYTQAGAYFITICASQRRRLFSEIVNSAVVLTDVGQIVQSCWEEIPTHFPHVELDAFVVMPNHVHGILWIVNDRRGAACRAPTTESFGKPVAGSLPTIVRSFKSAVTRLVNQQSNTPGGPVWQRGYYEHVIRDEPALARIRDYIAANPARWTLDRENRDHLGMVDFDRWLETDR